MSESRAPSEPLIELRTLGRLELSGTAFRQTRSLLLLTYLVLEGPRPRRFLAELLWPGATDPLNSLAVSLSKLRRLGVLGADDLRAWPEVRCDVQALREALLAGDARAAAGRYGGAFLDGVAGEAGAEFEEWALGWRETLAAQVRGALLDQAEGAAGRGQFEAAGQQAAQALELLGAPALESGELLRVTTLLTAAQHPARERLEREGQELGLPLPSSPEAARGQLRQTLLGRSRELERLLGLGLGEWAWVKGGAGLGKTSLLRELAAKSGWHLVSARSGLPYATLEALTDHLDGGEDAVLRRLQQARRDFILDDWHQVDPESQRLLIRLRALQPACRVVLAGVGEPPVPVAAQVDLGPLTADELASFPGAYEATDGVPALVGAWLRGEALSSALDLRLRALPDPARRVYLALALIDDDSLTLVRQALELSAPDMAAAVQVLLAAGLIHGSGRPHGREAARAYVQARPTDLAELSIRLARCLPEVQALPLYQQGRVLWEADDLPGIRRAYLTFARATLRRGFPARTAALLREAPPGPEITLLLGQALERVGEYREAMAAVRDLPESDEVLALRSALYWRLGQPEEARQAAERALDGRDESRAEALTTLGSLALSQGRFAEAEAYYRRATVLWSSLGEEERRVRALNNQALARVELGEDAQAAFQDILLAATDYPAIQALALLNLGFASLKARQVEAAERVYREAAAIAEAFGATALLVNVLTNLGALLHEQGQLEEARQIYERGLVLARQSGEQMFIAMLLTNLAELTGDPDALQEAMRLLKAGGHQALLAHAESIYARFMPVSGGQAQH